MSDKVPIRRLPTGVPGLDAILGGGVPEFSFNVIAGTPGAGKTTLVQQIMFVGASGPARPLLHRRYVELEGQLKRVMAAIKVRASAHEKDLRLFEITADGIVVGNRVGNYQGLLTGSPHLVDRQVPRRRDTRRRKSRL